MNTKQLKYVLTLAQEGSFSRAAETLSISQPSLSQYIKKIENSVGLSLFDRTNGDVKLTDAGMEYIETGRKILDLEHRMQLRLTDIATNKSGSLAIGAAPYRAASMLPVIAASFYSIYPGMCLIVREGTTAELTEGMERGEYDLCITLLPIDSRQFAWEKIMEEELVLAVPSSFPGFPSSVMLNRKYPAVDAAVLNGSRLVMLTEAQFMQRQLNNLMMDCQLKIEPLAVVKSLNAQIEMVKAGLGMALVPSGIERFCLHDEVTFYSFRQELPKREVVVMWRKDRTLSKVTEELKNIIRGIQW